MGAWANIDISTEGVTDAIEGLASELLSNAQTRSFDVTEITPKRLEASKGVVQRKVLTSNLAEDVDRYDGPEAMLDALAADTKLEAMVYEAVAYGFLHVYTDSNRVQAGGVYDEQGEDFEEDLEEQVDALAQTAPYVLGWETESGDSVGGSLTNAYDRYDA